MIRRNRYWIIAFVVVCILAIVAGSEAQRGGAWDSWRQFLTSAWTWSGTQTFGGSVAFTGDDIEVTEGGTGVSTLTDGGVLLGSGTGDVSATSVLSNGQLLIGDNSTDPAVATLTGTANEVSVSNGAGTITLSVGSALSSIAGLTETNGGHLYGTADNAYAWLGAGAEGTILMGNGAGAPSWLAAGATTTMLVGGGAADPVWTTATGTGSPMRGTSPTISTDVDIQPGTVTAAGARASSAIQIDNPTNIGALSQISFGYDVGLTNIPAFVSFISTNQDAYGYGDLIFGTRAVNTDTAASERIRIDSVGHLRSTGTAPALSSCGTSPTIGGSDANGKITIGTGSITSCTVTFASAYGAAPACTIAGDNTAVTYAATTSTTAITITSSGDMASDVISYICLGID